MQNQVFRVFPLIILFCLGLLISCQSDRSDKQSKSALDVSEDMITVSMDLPWYGKEPLELQARIIDGQVIYGGDIILGEADQLSTQAATQTTFLWPNNTVPYVINSGFSSTMRGYITSAINEFNRNTNLTWVAQSSERDYVTFVPATICQSSIGQYTGVNSNRIFLADNTLPSPYGCKSVGGVLHEMGHRVGLMHEHQRSDREITITSAAQNNASCHSFFQTFPPNQSTSYDPYSVMHYSDRVCSGQYYGSLNQAFYFWSFVNRNNVGPNTRSTLSSSDRSLINRIYPPRNACVANLTTQSCTTLNANGSWTSSGGRSSSHSGNPSYSFQVTRSGYVTIDLTSSVDTYLYLLNSSRNILESDDDDGSRRNSRIRRYLSSGTYYLVAATYSSRKSGSFSLSLQGSVSNLRLSSNTSGGSTTTITRSWTNSGGRTPSTSSGNKRYRLTINVSGTRTLDLTSPTVDTYLYLTDSSRRVIAQDDDGGSGRNSRITRYLSSGTYYVVAATYRTGQRGSFTLSVRRGTSNSSLSTTSEEDVLIEEELEELQSVE